MTNQSLPHCVSVSVHFSKSACSSVAEKRQRQEVALDLSLWKAKIRTEVDCPGGCSVSHQVQHFHSQCTKNTQIRWSMSTSTLYNLKKKIRWGVMLWFVKWRQPPLKESGSEAETIFLCVAAERNKREKICFRAPGLFHSSTFVLVILSSFLVY